jgi:hypothetical protein
MAKRIVLGGIVGGIVVFFWGFVAHMMLPLGEIGVHVIPDEASVIGPIRNAIKQPGFYLFPGMDMSGKASESEKQAWLEKAKQGPVGVLIVKPQGGEGITPRLLLTELGSNIVSALLAALLLSQVRISATYWVRVGFVLLLGVFGFVTILMPYWNWYSFPNDFVASEAIEHAVGWLLAGLVLAAIVKAPKGHAAKQNGVEF